MTTIETIRTVHVTVNDPPLGSHHEFEVRHPRAAERAHAIEARRRADWKGDPDAYRPSREFPCKGMRRLTDRDSTVWTIQCDGCGAVWGIPRSQIDTEILASNRLSTSRIPVDLATRPYEKTHGNEAARAMVRVLIERWGSDLAIHPPLVWGATGRGKSHLIASAAYELARRRLALVRFWTVPELLAAARRWIDRDGGPDEFIGRQASVELLVLDDLGAEHSTGWAQDVLYRLLDHRERHGLPVMGATNLEPGVWADVMGDRIASRLSALSTAVEITGDDYRERDTPPGGVGNVVPLPPRTPPTDL